MRYKTVHTGQILLITLLVLSIATTIALSLVARTTTDLNISNEVDESSRAFNAAEAGIEEALRLQASIGSQTVSGSNEMYEVTQTSIGGESGEYAFQRVTAGGEAETLWLVDHDSVTGMPDLSSRAYASNLIDVCFGDTGSALEVTVYYLSGGVYSAARQVYDSDPVRQLNNNFASISSGNCGSASTAFRKQIDLSVDLGILAGDIPILMRLRPLYAATNIAVNAPSPLPLQGNTYESCGTTGTGISRCISVAQNYKTPSGLFDYVIYSNAGSFAPTN